MHSMSRLSLGDNMNEDAVASILLAALDGLALQAMSNPDFDSVKCLWHTR